MTKTIQRIAILAFFCLLLLYVAAGGTVSGPPPQATERAPGATGRPYPLLPLPPGATSFRGGRYGADPAEIAVELDGDPPFTPEGYSALFARYGWTQLTTGCKGTRTTPEPTMTDTALLGVYAYGTGIDAPVVCVSKNMMVEEPFVYMTLTLYQCGVVRKAAPGAAASSEGCLIVVEGQ